MPPKERSRKTEMLAEDGSHNAEHAENEPRSTSFSLEPPSETTTLQIHAGAGTVDVMAEMSSPSGAQMSQSSTPGTGESHKHVKHHTHHSHSHEDPQPHGYDLRQHHGYNLRSHIDK